MHAVQWEIAMLHCSSIETRLFWHPWNSKSVLVLVRYPRPMHVYRGVNRAACAYDYLREILGNILIKDVSGIQGIPIIME